ncbi:hypothetical protein C5B96_05825 [Subtercola sp. Z020]|uniref:baeRF2 domain-containing protein n=1 Tax=Subtercola sp. Z020 TaxID=2080582 RepID=UPI000CE79166|nr:Vms1/Ankzf1 family peptidyl-tRNA hydrolase [Subtercola sp. Z020]PPF85585.1 hypothetical protein C5B96_05825 [Subtercola sp. Z020]
MNASTTTTTAQFADIARDPGPWSQVYLDASVDTGDPPQVTLERAKSAADQLSRTGAPPGDVEAVTDALSAELPAPSPLSHFVLVKEGVVVVDEWMPGYPVQPEIISFGPVPDLVPLVARQPPGFHVLVVETDRAGGEIRFYSAQTPSAESETHVQGRTDTLHAVKSGGWRQDLLQSHAREIWRQTQAELAAAVNEIVHREHPRLLVVAGEVSARQPLEGELSTESRDILSTLPIDTRADGSEPGALQRFVDQEIDRVLAAEKASVLDRIAMHEGRGDGTVATRFGEVVNALSAAQAETLMMNVDLLRYRTVLALDRAPWIATAPEDVAAAEILAVVDAPAGLVRAAILTDATIHVTDRDPDPNLDAEASRDAASDPIDTRTLPGDAAVAALLRWPLGPPVPAT